MSPRVRARSLAVAAAAGAALSVALVAPPAMADASADYAGSLSNGTTWLASVPSDWNGTVLLYSHGYHPSFVPGNPASVAPDDATKALLLERGYALVGSSYAASGWAVPTAVDDQLQSLDAMLDQTGLEPDHIMAYGTSMGGLVTGRIAESAGDVIDGAMPTCGLMEGAVDLNNYQLDGSHAIEQLLAGQELKIEGYASLDEAFATSAALSAAVQEGQKRPEGRARVALAAALFHLSDGVPAAEATKDTAVQQESLYTQLLGTIGFVTPGRFDIESTAGGNATWNVGVDYGKLFAQSEDRALVAKLYREAGLDLKADLETLTQTADIAADPGSVETLRASSTLTGDLQMPVVSMHTLDDVLAPVQVEQEYAEDVRGAHDANLLRQFFVDHVGHCNFTPAEIAAGIEVLQQRVESGHWSGNSATVMNRLAASLDDSGSAFVATQPGEFLGDREGSR
ncbi:MULTISPECIES: prolyl oligopeptidase family serine peptidase [unclassified Microbacterium]|uniref:alpha/beta hydrolase family protein n=1 Tax=unclassified Microbacterium TaxID=2609290 RepID=UPI00214CC985|nr:MULTISPECIES: prolyl oligopeptidase family serine peptidase [unclassified Microbacterium]MCR2808332.1 prolyl oligopeptidase family serine peptidase [Microbacterium sp. zg.B185]WIM19216.1 prolyl oligopeptidase family serine peptidase [Microbacterium sp. zg-B185]